MEPCLELKNEIWPQFVLPFLSVLCCYNAKGERRELREGNYMYGEAPLGLSMGGSVWGEGDTSEKLGGVCSPRPKTFNLFTTKICDFPYPIRSPDDTSTSKAN